MGLKDRMKAMAEKSQDALEQVRDEGAERGLHVRAEADARAAHKAAEWKAAGILFQCKSHEEGRNSTVTLFGDRIERVKDRSLGSFSKAKQDAEIIPLRSLSSVQAKKDGLVYTKVTAYASGNTIDFRMRHEEAQRFKDLIAQIVLNGARNPTLKAAAPLEPDPLEQLKKLGELRDAGIVSDAEFEAKKKKLLDL